MVLGALRDMQVGTEHTKSLGEPPLLGDFTCDSDKPMEKIMASLNNKIVISGGRSFRPKPGFGPAICVGESSKRALATINQAPAPTGLVTAAMSPKYRVLIAQMRARRESTSAKSGKTVILDRSTGEYPRDGVAALAPHGIKPHGYAMRTVMAQESYQSVRSKGVMSPNCALRQLDSPPFGGLHGNKTYVGNGSPRPAMFSPLSDKSRNGGQTLIEVSARRKEHRGSGEQTTEIAQSVSSGDGTSLLSLLAGGCNCCL